MHYFDARFLASYLLSSCDFIDPVNLRPLTLQECQALDAHLRQHHWDEQGTSVGDAFELFERNVGRQDDDESASMHAVRREATAVLQHLFRFRSARRTDQRGRAIAYADSGLMVVDDDDILTSGPPAASSAPPVPPEPVLPERATSLDYPGLGGPPSGGAPGTSAKAKAWGPGMAAKAEAKAASNSKGGRAP